MTQDQAQGYPANVPPTTSATPADRQGLAEPLRQRFNRIAIAAVLLLGIIFSGYGYYDRHLVVTIGEESSRQIAEQTALAAEGALDRARQVLNAMALLTRWAAAKQSPGDSAIRSELINLKASNPYLMDLLIVSADGRIQHWTGPGEPPDITDRAYYTTHLQNGPSGLYVGLPRLSRVHADKWFFALSQSVRDSDGRLAHVLVATIDVALLRSQLGVRQILPESSQALLARDGTIYVRTPGHHQFVGKKLVRPEFDLLTAAEPLITTRRTSQLDDKERLLSFRLLSGYPLIATGTVTLDDILRPWRQRAFIVLIFWLALSLAIVQLARRASAVSRRQTELATLDGLTGIYNRRTILDTAEQLDRSAAHAGTLSILMIDVDHFKQVNDRYGHATGDDVLCQITHVLRAQIRATDFLGRYGGEEFLVLMPDTGTEGALKVAEKLRATVETTVRHPQPVTISIGIATAQATDPTLDRTLARADAALYEAKAAGRNCVRVAS